jgi:hypothetical protein
MPRQEDRVTFLTEVTLQFASGRREARISDLSAGGCYVECVAMVRPGEIVRFDMPMPDGKTAQATGEVKYVFNGMGFGMRFQDVPEDMRALFDRLIESSPAVAG